jgi:hypothetical protein
MVVSVNAKKKAVEQNMKKYGKIATSVSDKTDKPFRDFTQYLYPLNTVWKVSLIFMDLVEDTVEKVMTDEGILMKVLKHS